MRDFLTSIEYRLTVKSVSVGVIIITGLILTVFLVQREQNIRSRANTIDVNNAFDIKDEKGEKITCNEGKCVTDSKKIKIKVNDVKLLIPEQ